MMQVLLHMTLHASLCVLFPQQVESGRHENSLTLLSMSSVAVRTTLPPSGTCLPTMVELASQHAKGNGHSVDPQVNNNTINKSENPEASSDMTPVVSPPTVEAAKTQDYTRCQSIPEGETGSVCSTEETVWGQMNTRFILYFLLFCGYCLQRCCMVGGECRTLTKCTVWSRLCTAVASGRKSCTDKSKNIWSL